MSSEPVNVDWSTATAASLDGRLFQFRGPLGTPVDPGGFVTLTETGGRRQIGQIDDVRFAPDDSLTGVGKIVGVLDADGRLDVKHSFAFTVAELTATDADTIDRVFAEAGGTLNVGSLIASDGIPARLLPHRFNRHTFWCGQSGSGKTYALGVLMEQLLLHTSLPMVVFDPNADFVRLREPSGDESAASDEHRMLAQRDIRILRPGPSDHDSLRVRFVDMPLPSKAAVLRLDPLDDRAEYNELMHIEETVGVLDADQIIPKLLERETPAARALAARIENLRLIDWEVWAGEFAAVTDVLDTRPDATVLDLGGFGYPDESLVVALAVLDDLWAKREQRRPILIVIDEAHNLCSPDAQGPLPRAVRDRLIQIAAEGRKFGLWLLLSTQRPSRIHPSIISQCDNLALMKMTSPLDLDELATIFGFVPPAMLARSPRFRQGEALFAGGFVPAPTMIAMGARLTREGGADVGVPIRS
ncbi:ATP-binding protein [Leifsonia sp. NPDC058248]|uniref:ATP-binding protein n=1 Tax=Leifsonia sp. NPDC058248 TaxID=3346402 RepID=UPI0036DF6DAB